MLKIFFMALIILSTLAGGSQILISNMLRATMIVENQSIVTGTMNRLKQSVLFSNGDYYLPYGVNEDGYHALPLSFLGLRKSAQGRDIIYCPYAPSIITTSTGTVSLPNSTSYDVTLSNTFSPDGTDYVVESTASPVLGVAAALIMPQRSADLPSCDDIDTNADGEFILSGNSADKGMVYVLTNSEVAFIYRGGVNEFVQVADASTKLNAALREAALKPSENAVITLESGGTFQISESFVFQSSDSNLPRSIVVKSSVPGTTAQISSSAARSLQFDGVNVTFNDVVLGTNIQISSNDTRLNLKNFGALRLVAYASDITLDNASFGRNGVNAAALDISASNVKQNGSLWIQGIASPMVSMQNSDWVSSSNISIDYVGGSSSPVRKISLENSSMDLRNLTVSSSGSASQGTLFYVSPSSKLNLSGITWNNSGSLNVGFEVFGDSHIVNAALNGSRNVNIVLWAQSGSGIRVEGSTVGTTANRPSVGIQSSYASQITGPYRQPPPGASPLIGAQVSVAADNCTDGWKFVDDVYSGENVSFYVDDIYVKAVDPFFGSVISNTDPFNTNANDVSASLVVTCL